jgi:hypothetical protein
MPKSSESASFSRSAIGGDISVIKWMWLDPDEKDISLPQDQINENLGSRPGPSLKIQTMLPAKRTGYRYPGHMSFCKISYTVMTSSNPMNTVAAESVR